MTYFKTNAPLASLLFGGGKPAWDTCGLSAVMVAKAVREGFQQRDSDGNIVTIFPVSDMELLQQTVQNHQYVLDAGYYFEVISEEQAISLRDTLKAANDEAERQNALTPTDEDLYRASVLKLLTEIKMSGQGGEGNV